jgi:hypothetical protein
MMQHLMPKNKCVQWNIMALMLVSLMGTMVSGCQTSSRPSSLSEWADTIKGPELKQLDEESAYRAAPFQQAEQPGEKASPYGVYDIQSGHGNGKWRKSPDNLAR